MPHPSRMMLVLQRRWRLWEELATARIGRSVPALIEALGVSRATLYRDLDALRDVSVPLIHETVNGEARYRILCSDRRVAPTSPARRLALDVALAALAPLRGSSMVRELERLRAELPADGRGRVVTRGATPTGARSDVVASVERALREARSLELAYRGARDDAVAVRRVVPLELRLVKQQPYLVAHDLDRGELRTFKLVRVERARLGAPFDRSRYATGDATTSVVAWAGPLVDVAVRFDAAVARFVVEYPLIDGQAVDSEPDGAVVVRARVAGIEETLRWVLGWGRAARVLAPPELVDRVAEELRAALAAYRSSVHAEDDEDVSRIVRRRRAKLARTSTGSTQHERRAGKPAG